MPSSIEKSVIVVVVLLQSMMSTKGFQMIATRTRSTKLKYPPLSKLQRPKPSMFTIPFDSLMDMDVVIYSNINNTTNDRDDTKMIGAVQEDGTLLPLSAWSQEPAFGNSIEFLVDEEDRNGGLDLATIQIESIVPEESLSYGSRQVGGGKGPGNPHGEESELLYYVDQDLLDGVQIKIKPELEILW